MFNHLRLARRLCVAGAALAVAGAALGVSGGASFADSVGAGSTITAGNTPYSTVGQICDPNRNGYHFIVNGLVYPAGSTINAADFGVINITFSNGTTATASFTDLSGDQTAHFLNNTVNQTGNFTITSATLTFPAGSDITAYGNFRISHPPCGTTVLVVVTTTTIAPTTTTTTIAPTTTTTTIKPTTAGTIPPTTTIAPTTSVVRSDSPLPTTTIAPTTTLVGSISPMPTTTIAASAGPVPTTVSPAMRGALPVTGSAGGRIAILGLFILSFGLVMLGLARRRTVQS